MSVSLEDLLLNVTWDQEEDDPTRKVYWAMYRWMEQASRDIERLTVALDDERRLRTAADATLDAMLWSATS